MSKVLYKSTEVDNVLNLEFVEISQPVFESLEIKKKENEVSNINSQISSLNEELKILRTEKLKLESEISKSQKCANEEVRIEALKLIEEAKVRASEIVEASKREAELLEKEAIDKKESVELESNAEIDKLVKEYEKKLREDVDRERAKSVQEGYDEGYKKGLDDFDKILLKLHSIVATLVSERKKILDSSGEQIINLVMQIAIKVIKKITDSQKGIILENVNEALKRIKHKTQIIIRVNLDDLDIVRYKKSDFVSKFDVIENLEVIEDPNIGKGGCIVETNFGEIDARISSQIDRIEEIIKNFSPLN